MDLMKSINKAVREKGMHISWMPMIDNHQPGDFGTSHNGIFTKQGNISELGVNFEVEDGGENVKINFQSAGVSSSGVKVGGAGNVEAIGDAKASLTFKFEKENSCLLKGSMSIKKLANLFQISEQLKNLEAWQRRFYLVGAIYEGKDFIIIGSEEGGVEVSIEASVDVLKAVEAGELSSSSGISSSKNASVEFIGKTGTVGLKLYKFGFFGGFEPKSKGENGKSIPEALKEVEVELLEDEPEIV